MQVQIEDCSELDGETFEARRYYFYALVFVARGGKVRKYGMPFAYTIEGGIELDPRFEGPEAEIFARAVTLLSLAEIDAIVLDAESSVQAFERRVSLVM
jgi:hypothetical protein